MMFVEVEEGNADADVMQMWHVRARTNINETEGQGKSKDARTSKINFKTPKKFSAKLPGMYN